MYTVQLQLALSLILTLNRLSISSALHGKRQYSCYLELLVPCEIHQLRQSGNKQPGNE